MPDIPEEGLVAAELCRDRPVREIVQAAAPAIRKQERERVEAEHPKAGQMHPADKAFYDLTVKERGHAWAESERHARERDEARKQERELIEAEHEPVPGEPKTGWTCGGSRMWQDEGSDPEAPTGGKCPGCRDCIPAIRDQARKQRDEELRERLEAIKRYRIGSDSEIGPPEPYEHREGPWVRLEDALAIFEEADDE